MPAGTFGGAGIDLSRWRKRARGHTFVAVNVAAAPDSRLPRWQRLLLPALVGAPDARRDPDGGTDLPRSLRDWMVDITLFGFAVIVASGATIAHRNQVSHLLLAIDGLLGAIACLSLWVRRRHPLVVGWLTVGLWAFSSAASGAALVAVLTVAVHCVPRRTLQLTALAVVANAICAGIYRSGPSGSRGYAFTSLAFGTILTLAVVGFGSYVRARRELLLSLQERARRAEDEQQLRVREARLAERSRIAREMHDVLAHRISLLSVHAGALEFNPDASPDEVARAAGVIRVSARAAQEELREVIGVLRASTGAEGVEPPQPTIGDIGRLVEESRAAGMDVSLRNAIEHDESLPPIIGRTVYRVVQEALTNARKHAPGEVVTITLGGDPDAGVRVEVVNRPWVGQATRPARERDGDERHVGSGTGLVGLAERVTLVGGELQSERLPSGGFSLTATLPWNLAGDPETPA